MFCHFRILKTSFPKTIVFILICLFITSCKLYREPLSLNEALTENKGLVKLTLHNGDEFIYQSLEQEGSHIYGLQKSNDGIERIQLNNEDVKEVRYYNKTGSTVVKILGFGVVVGSVLLLGTMF